jgi:hypothetical protein
MKYELQRANGKEVMAVIEPGNSGSRIDYTRLLENRIYSPLKLPVT